MTSSKAAWAIARRAWPTVRVGEDDYSAFVAARAPADGASLDGAGCYLACALASGDRAALLVFERALVPRLERALQGYGASADQVAEALQRTRARLLVGPEPKITTYAGRGSLQAWLRTVCRRELLQLHRRPAAERAERLASDDEPWLVELACASADPELEHLASQYRAEFAAAFKEALGALERGDRQLLRMHYLDGLTMAEIGERQNVHQTTITRRLAKARSALLTGAVEQMRSKLAVAPGEMESILRLCQSGVEITLSALVSQDR